MSTDSGAELKKKRNYKKLIMSWHYGYKYINHLVKTMESTDNKTDTQNSKT